MAQTSFRKKRESGQAMLEYTLVVICLIAAFLAIQYYVSRAMQGRVRSLADQISDRSYEPGVTTTGQDGMVISSEREVLTESKSFLPLTVNEIQGVVSVSKMTVEKDETAQKGAEITPLTK